jgi:hypothetical protein
MSRRTLLIFAIAAAMALPASVSVRGQAAPAGRGVDLGVGRGADSHRPNILVAWRNSERILEVEVLVRNMGDRPGRGKVVLDISDETGKTLLSTQPFDVAVPARAEGGEEGTVVQTKGFRLMNIMFDELDRLDQRYKLRARVETEGEDLNPVDNIATKSFNVDGRALPASTTMYRYRLVNPSDSALNANVYLEHTAVPAGWTMTADPPAGTKVVLGPKEVFTGYVTVKTPKTVTDGQHIDLQAGLIEFNNAKKRVVDLDEWYFVATSQPPQVDNPTWTEKSDGSVVVNVAAYDPLSGIKEASGVQVAYSLDQGTTFSNRVMAYVRGNFYDKTWFEANLGPFISGVELSAVVTVANNAGITRRFDLPAMKIGEKATSTAANTAGSRPSQTQR